MTNTSDFRRYSFATDTAYIINQFDFSRASTAQAAPRLEPEIDVERDFKVRENVKIKSRAQLKNEQRKAFGQMLMTFGVALLCFLLIGLVINSFVIKNELTKEISARQVDISNAQSENISLQAQLDGLVSISMIDEYAVSKLGMTKVKSNQIQYMDVSEYKAQRMDKINSQGFAQTTKQLTDLKGNK